MPLMVATAVFILTPLSSSADFPNGLNQGPRNRRANIRWHAASENDQRGPDLPEADKPNLFFREILYA